MPLSLSLDGIIIAITPVLLESEKIRDVEFERFREWKQQITMRGLHDSSPGFGFPRNSNCVRIASFAELRRLRTLCLSPFVKDHDRPLSRTGQSDAIEVSQKLQKLGWIPELILYSDAVRTRETLAIMQEQVKGFLEAEVHFISSFYSIVAMDGQTAEHLQHAICKFSRDEILTVMCMGHNRGWEEAASKFSGASIELKTCNAALLEATGKSWEEVKRFFPPTQFILPSFTLHLPYFLWITITMGQQSLSVDAVELLIEELEMYMKLMHPTLSEIFNTVQSNGHDIRALHVAMHLV
ncbi:hypothetical protein RHMOL_Rhmol10G0091300 [Rhododendron molle]|uniref:Uncharacterized protein n=1 Tax=Rhododendron molle TaxID=49168 RepID=A0ACC0M1I8_RHOML|nr:hypothetical protein RHMOL_Rhmol10G0091300 [Rhododendron molle]